MKSSALLAALFLGLAAVARSQTVTIDIDAGLLENALGTAVVPSGGLLQLIASPSGTFSAPTSSSYVTGDNVLVQSFGASYTQSGVNGETFNALPSISLAAFSLTAGEKMELRFYPSLTFTNMPASPTLLTTFGEVRSDTIEFGSAGNVPGETPWIVPGAGATVNFEYITANDGGTYANSSADATGVVLTGSAVPEPSTDAVVGFAGICLLGWWLRNKAASTVA